MWWLAAKTPWASDPGHKTQDVHIPGIVGILAPGHWFQDHGSWILGPCSWTGEKPLSPFLDPGSCLLRVSWFVELASWDPGCCTQDHGGAWVLRKMGTRRKMDTLGIEPRASRMVSGCDTTTPCAQCSLFRVEFRPRGADA